MKRKRPVMILTAMLGSIVLTGLLMGMQTDAGVAATEEGAGGTDCIYVAGCPDWYPVEYYDEDSESYEGVMPQLLERIGERTGLNFTYVRAGEDDVRLRLAQNGQVEMVSGCRKDEEGFEEASLTASRVILTFTEDGQKTDVCFYFTEIAGDDLTEAVNGALDEISGQEVAGIAVGSVVEEQRQGIPSWLIVLVLVFWVLAVCVIVLLIVRVRRYKRELAKDEMFDPILGIGNKEYFIWNFDQNISEQYRAIYSIVYIGFDIERVNHYYGEDKAEEQLKFAARELMRSTQDTDIAARVSGGGFAIAHPCSGEKELEKWVVRLLGRLNQYSDKFGRDYRPEFCAGIYTLSQTDQDCELALNNARKGYQYAVSHNRSYAFSKAGLLRNEDEKLQLKKRTHEALQKHEFQMFLQFIVSAGEEKVVGAEALSRWNHPQKGLLHPGSYIELMESEKTIAELDFYIFEEACRQLERWAKEGQKTSISCNFTRITIDHENFPSKLKSIAEKYFFDYSSLILEITEDVMEIHKEAAFENISRCKAMGFRIALDDAGSGYTSFSDLRDYPIDVVKIDRSILCSAVNEKGIALLKGMMALVHSLGMEVLCEGVETKEQVELLRKLGCDYMQGYYFYRALPVEEAGRLLLERGENNEIRKK